MKPRPITVADLNYFDSDAVTHYAGDPDTEVAGVDAIEADNPLNPGQVIVHIPWELDEIELMQLATGGTLWFSSIGGLAPHLMHVQPPKASGLLDIEGQPL